MLGRFEYAAINSCRRVWDAKFGFGPRDFIVAYAFQAFSQFTGIDRVLNGGDSVRRKLRVALR